MPGSRLPQRLRAEPAGGRSGGELPDPPGFSDPVPGAAGENGIRFRREVERFAETNGIPLVRFAKRDRKLKVMRPHLDRLARAGRTGVAAIGTRLDSTGTQLGEQLLGIEETHQLAAPRASGATRGTALPDAGPVIAWWYVQRLRRSVTSRSGSGQRRPRGVHDVGSASDILLERLIESSEVGAVAVYRKRDVLRPVLQVLRVRMRLG